MRWWKYTEVPFPLLLASEACRRVIRPAEGIPPGGAWGDQGPLSGGDGAGAARSRGDPLPAAARRHRRAGPVPLAAGEASVQTPAAGASAGKARRLCSREERATRIGAGEAGRGSSGREGGSC